MATSTALPLPQLERMAGELRCPICLSLYNQAASLTCNHCFCTSCIVLSMKWISSCPVCKIPATPREVRPAPQMDNLVAIFKGMESIAGVSMFQSQLSIPDSPEEEMQTFKLPERTKTRLDSDFSGAAEGPPKEMSNVTTGAQRSVQFPNSPPRSTNHRPSPIPDLNGAPAEATALIDEDLQSMNFTDADAQTRMNVGSPRPGEDHVIEGADGGYVENLQREGSRLPPFFWVGDRVLPSQEEPPTQTQTQNLAACPVRPSFSDLKGSDDEFSEDDCAVDEVVCNVNECAQADSYDSDTFEWTQRPCSPELSSSPFKLLDERLYGSIDVEVVRSREEEDDEGHPPMLFEGPSTVRATQTPQLLREPARSSKKGRKRVKQADDRANIKIRRGTRRSDGAPSPIPYRKRAARAASLNFPKKLSRNRVASVVKDRSPRSILPTNPVSMLDKPRRKRQLEVDLASSSKDDLTTAKAGGAVKIAGNDLACVFCGSDGNSEVAGPIKSYKETLASKRVKIFHVHKLCAEWAPDVYFQDSLPKNLAREIRRGKRIKCSSCGKRGAALGCCNERCKRSFHYPCGRAISGCSWNENDFVMFCPQHADCTFPKRKRCTAIPTQEALLTTKRYAKLSREEPPSRSNLKLPDEHQRWPQGLAPKWVLCGSGLNAEAKAQLVSFASLTGASITKRWNSSVTHVITAVDKNGAAKRTLKFLLSTLLSKWTVTTEWIEACQKLGHPVTESKYVVSRDVNGIIGGPQRSLVNAAAKGPDLLQGLSFYFCGEFKSASKGDLQILVTAGGGAVLQRKPLRAAQSVDNAPSLSRNSGLNSLSGNRAIVIYDSAGASNGALSEMEDAFSIARQAGADVVAHSWLLDSVAGFALQPIPKMHSM